MKLASLKAGGRDGTLIIVNRALDRAVRVPHIAPTLQRALDDWEACESQLRAAYDALEHGSAAGAFTVDVDTLAAPLPRAYQWLDGSAYLSHVELVRRARGAALPPELYTDALMYQGCSDPFLAARDPIPTAGETWGTDFEAEVAVIVDDVQMGTGPAAAGAHVKLIVLVNDVSLRNLIPAELAKGFGFIHGKPPCALSPVAVTPDELGHAWDGARLHLPLVTQWNGERFGDPDAGADMQFGFPELIAHAAKTRPLRAGTIIGGGTVSNRDAARGASCIVEKRTRELIERGKAETRFLAAGDRVRIEMLDANGHSIFGAIEQRVEAC